MHEESKKVLKELQAIADRLNLLIEDEMVGLTWTGNGRKFAPEVYKEVLEPFYFAKSQKKDVPCNKSS